MKTRIAYLGYGPRGKSLIGNLLDMDDVEITVTVIRISAMTAFIAFFINIYLAILVLSDIDCISIIIHIFHFVNIFEDIYHFTNRACCDIIYKTKKDTKSTL